MRKKNLIVTLMMGLSVCLCCSSCSHDSDDEELEAAYYDDTNKVVEITSKIVEISGIRYELFDDHFEMMGLNRNSTLRSGKKTICGKIHFRGKDYPVTAIQPFISRGNYFTQLTIQEGVTTIMNNAFYENTSLTTITLPESITEISYNIFFGCI